MDRWLFSAQRSDFSRRVKFLSEVLEIRGDKKGVVYLYSIFVFA